MMLRILHKGVVHKRRQQPVFHLRSVASNCVFLLCKVVELSFSSTLVNEDA